MKFLLISAVLIISIYFVHSEPLEQPKIAAKWKSLMTKLDKIDPKDVNNLVFMNHLIQYHEHYENITRVQGMNQDRVYLGCFKDHRRQRMFRGYAEKGSNAMHIDGCIHLCRQYRFVYAGVQSGNECFCGNSAPQTAYNAKLSEGSCDKKCSSVGHRNEICGGSWASSVYTTGFKVTRQDENGNTIGEHSSYSKNEWERH